MKHRSDLAGKLQSRAPLKKSQSEDVSHHQSRSQSGDVTRRQSERRRAPPPPTHAEGLSLFDLMDQEISHVGLTLFVPSNSESVASPSPSNTGAKMSKVGVR